ncbi:MAG: hypothetical protein QOD06_223 [Candidatus Binatota bacterium]|nr:hypothetical protein [Candidatus Binatota bacterium]
MKPNYERILCLVDADDHSRAALALAKIFARERKGTIFLVNAHSIYESPFDPEVARSKAGWSIAEGEATTRKRIEKVAQDQIGSEFPWEVIVHNGVDDILNSVRRHEVDLVILHKRPDSGVREWLVGNTAYQVARRAPCDVLLLA